MIKARITLDTGMWIVTLDHGDMHFSRNCWTRAKAEETADSFERLAKANMEAQA